MRLVQFIGDDGKRHVAWVQNTEKLWVLRDASSVRDLALEAHEAGRRLAAIVQNHLAEAIIDYAPVVAEKRLLPPLDHPDPAHCLVTGTGLTHLGSAKARDTMHDQAAEPAAPATDSMRMFELGMKGGKPGPGKIGVQPEWFYKGNGACIVPPEQPLELPPYALDGGEEAEIVGLYVIGEDGTVLRVGYALGNEFSDHVMERENYLYLAHSKLRQCSIGPELLLDMLPASITGRVRVLRKGKELWAADVVTGEQNMSHTLANLEHHHFKYAAFRRPGDVHCYFFGAAVLSFSAGVKTAPGDVFEISAPEFGRPLRNPLVRGERKQNLVTVKML